MGLCLACQEDEIMPLHVETVMKALFDELRFMKQQQWTITNYGVLILAAIFAVRQLLTFNHSQTYLKGAALLIAIAVSGLLLRIHLDVAGTRYRLDDVHNNFFTSN